jgi:hypothetical protein
MLKKLVLLGLVVACVLFVRLGFEQREKGHFIEVSRQKAVQLSKSAVEQSKRAGTEGIERDQDQFCKFRIQLTTQEWLLVDCDKVSLENTKTKTKRDIGGLHYPLPSTATRLNNGEILFTGGRNKTELRLVVRLFQDCSDPSGAELFDPQTMSLIKAGHLRYPRDNYQALLLKNGTVLIRGGRDCSSCDSGENLCGDPPPKDELYIPE